LSNLNNNIDNNSNNNNNDIKINRSANKLPPHRPYDYEIKLKPESMIFYSFIYLLRENEFTALKKHIDEKLSNGFIRKSKFPV